MLIRTISGALLLAVMFVLIHFGRLYLVAGLLAMSLIGLHEMYRCLESGGAKLYKRTGYVLCILYYAALAVFGESLLRSGFVLYAAAIMLVVLMAERVAVYPRHAVQDTALTMWSLLYVPVFFSFLYFLREQTDGRFYVWFIFLSSWGCDTAAYLAGRAFGRHKLAPQLSPKKTVEGAVGGVVGAMLLCCVYAICIAPYVQTDRTALIILSLCMGFFGAVLAQLGDLFASSVKRQMNIKDYGQLIPGHGGILDRFDSTLMVAPVLMVVFDLVNIILAAA